MFALEFPAGRWTVLEETTLSSIGPQAKMKAENHQANGPIVAIRVEQKHNLRMHLMRVKGRRVIRCI